MKRPYLKKTAIAVLYLLFLVTVLEGTARLIVPLYLDWIEKPFCTGELAKIQYVHSFSHWMGKDYVHDDKLGYRLRPNLRSRTMNGGAVNSNRLGARGVREVDQESPAGVTRIVTIGDSFTFGDGVDDEQAWPARLERMLSGVEVINFGTGGYGMGQVILSFEELASRLEPDFVILGLGEYQYRNTLDFFCAPKPRFAVGSQGLELHNVPVPTHDDLRDEVTYRSSHFLSILQTLFAPSQEDYLPPEESYTICRLLIERLVAAARRTGTRVVVATIPTPGLLKPLAQVFEKACSSSGIDCVDTRPRFREGEIRSDPATFRRQHFIPNDGHYSAKGNELVAQEIAVFFREKVFTAPPSNPR